MTSPPRVTPSRALRQMSLERMDALLPRALEPDIEAEAMRRRLAARLFGAASPPLAIGRFHVREVLGSGGMGIVYAAQDTRLERQVALKLLRGDLVPTEPRERERLLDEARALARLSHPNVVQVHEVGEHDGGVFIVMEQIRGATLRQWLDVEKRSLPEILERFVQAARGLDAAHRLGIVHRDFKPTNALVGEDGRVRIVDFGLALNVASDATADEPTGRDGDPAGATGRS